MKEYAEVDLEVITWTEEAIFTNDGDNPFWIPKSLINNFDEYDIQKGSSLTFEIEEWFAIKVGLV